MLDQIGVAPGASCIDLGCGARDLASLERQGRGCGEGGGSGARSPAAGGCQALRRRASAIKRAGAGRGHLRRRPPPTAPPLGHSTSSMPASSPVHGRGRSCCGRCSLWPARGVVAMQEPVANTWRCYPARPAWDRLVQTIAMALGRAGGDLSAGQRTYRLFRRAGLEDVRVRAAVVALQMRTLMRLPVLLADALRPQILEGGCWRRRSWTTCCGPAVERPGRGDVRHLVPGDAGVGTPGLSCRPPTWRHMSSRCSLSSGAASPCRCASRRAPGGG